MLQQRQHRHHNHAAAETAQAARQSANHCKKRTQQLSLPLNFCAKHMQWNDLSRCAKPGTHQALKSSRGEVVVSEVKGNELWYSALSFKHRPYCLHAGNEVHGACKIHRKEVQARDNMLGGGGVVAMLALCAAASHKAIIQALLTF
eukprot:1158419-Pelagomonas_calceolata.AAC.7